MLNRVHTKAKPLTPYEIWTDTKLDFSKLKICGCKVDVLNFKPPYDKIGVKTWEFKFIGW